MFQKKPPSFDYHQLDSDFSSFQERTHNIESSRSKIDSSLKRLDLQWHTLMSRFAAQIDKSQERLSGMQEQSNEVVDQFKNLVTALRMSVMREDFVKVKRKIDQMDFERYITREEFELMLKEQR